MTTDTRGYDANSAAGSSAAGTGSMFLLLVIIILVVVMTSMNGGGARSRNESPSSPPQRLEPRRPAIQPPPLPPPAERPRSPERPDSSSQQPSLSERNDNRRRPPPTPPLPERNEVDWEEEQQPPPEETAAEQPKRRKTAYNLARTYDSLQTLVTNICSTTRRTLDRIPFDECTIDEQVMLLVCGYMNKRVTHSRDKPVSVSRLNDTLDRIIHEKTWSHLTYLVTMFALEPTVLQRIGSNLKTSIEADFITQRDRSALLADLLFLNIMMCGRGDQPIKRSNIFLGERVYVRPGSLPVHENTALVLQMMITRYCSVCELELQNRLDHTRSELNVQHYLRYWQIELMRLNLDSRYHHHFDHRGFGRFLTLQVRDTCLATIGRSYAMPYEVLALQILMRMVAEDSNLFYGADHTCGRFAKHLAQSLHRVYTEARAYIPTFILDQTAFPAISLDQLDQLHPTQIVQLEYPRNAIYNQSSKQISLMHSTYSHNLVLNRTIAPLPVFDDQLNTMCGRLYLGTGLVANFRQIEGFAFKQIDNEPKDLDVADEMDASRPMADRTVQRRRTFVFPFAYDRDAYDTADSVRGSLQRLQLKGVTCLDTNSPLPITHLQLQTLDRAYNRVADTHEAWLLHLMAAFMRPDTHTRPLGRDKFPLGIGDLERNAMLETGPFFDLAIVAYRTALNQLRRETAVPVSDERIARRRYRQQLFDAGPTTPKPVKPIREKWWYAGVRSCADEPIDPFSTDEVTERAVSRTEEQLWINLNPYLQRIDRRMEQLFNPRHVNVQGVLRHRFAGFVAFGLVAARLHRLQSANHQHDDLLSAAAYQALTRYVKLSPPPRAISSAARLRHPAMFAVIYERVLEADSDAAQAATVLFTTADSYDRVSESRLHSPRTNVFSRVLRPALNVSPADLVNNSYVELEQQLDVSFDDTMITSLDLPDTEFGEPHSIHLWFQPHRKRGGSRAADTSDPATMRNLVSLRIPSKTKQDFIIYNLVHNHVQYLMVAQASKIVPSAIVAATPSERMVGYSSLWYTVCTHETSTPIGQLNAIVLDQAGSHFYSRVLQHKRTPLSTVHEAPAFHLQSGTTDQVVNVSYDPKTVQRYTFGPPLRHETSITAADTSS